MESDEVSADWDAYERCQQEMLEEQVRADIAAFNTVDTDSGDEPCVSNRLFRFGRARWVASRQRRRWSRQKVDPRREERVSAHRDSCQKCAAATARILGRDLTDTLCGPQADETVKWATETLTEAMRTLLEETGAVLI